jgi:hypothetical protein
METVEMDIAVVIETKTKGSAMETLRVLVYFFSGPG